MPTKEIDNYPRLSKDQPAEYRIRIKGELDESWSDRMGGMQISRQTDVDTSMMSTLEGQLLDQAALFGVLVALYNMRLPLISVECLEAKGENENLLIKVRVEQKTDYLEFIVTGMNDALQPPEPLETILNSCELAGIYQVLVDYRGLLGGNRSEPEIGYTQGVGQLYQEYLAMGGSPIRIAVVGSEDVVEAWKQSEEIARGYDIDVLVTDDYEDAIAWLRS